MSKKHSKLLSKKKLLEVKIKDGLTNLEEFTRIMADNIDFNSFDVLSITRTDSKQQYTRQFAHRKVDTQAFRIASDAIKSIPFSLYKYKLN